MKNKLFVDASCLLEILLTRDKAELVLEIFKSYQNLYISPISVHLVYYFAEKKDYDGDLLMGFLNKFTVADFDATTSYTAQDIYNGKDMEDCLQVATAMTNNIKTILTLDNGMKRFKPYVEVVIV